ncbi:CRISPR-associated endonuclease Cas2 [Methanococcus voltae]|uniref:CRISPR-associated endoribonuclease Cas2 n=1 Tax=Methanococcus voltae TaxID=2188 RepID=A0A8J7UUE1_METVO|nr:CRISPR-associated endonuclease Cas2 [Methanococcus voltae]MBP2173198.1 CRISPR-associated protein Cas2 [Methanococcus voltae]MBP2201226.1 CRISPR-associated protein Cas2 [Methanococcus voltae]
MYVIIVYDVSVARVNHIKKFLRRYLTWVQNSVFEGELTKSEFETVKIGLKNLMDEDYDSVIIFKNNHLKYIDRQILGVDKNELSDIL